MSCFEKIIAESLVCLDLQATEGKAIIEALIGAAVEGGLLRPEHYEAVARAVINRELSASTALPDGIALPHGRTEHVAEIVAIFGVHPQGVDFGAPDNRSSRIFVLLLVPTTSSCNHIHFLARLSRCLMESAVRNDLMAATTAAGFKDIILNHSGEGTSK